MKRLTILSLTGLLAVSSIGVAAPTPGSVSISDLKLVNEQVNPGAAVEPGTQWRGFRWGAFRWRGFRWSGYRWRGYRWSGFRHRGFRWHVPGAPEAGTFDTNSLPSPQR